MTNINGIIFNFINGGAGYYHSLDLFLLFFTSYLAYWISIAIGIYILFIVPFRKNTVHDRLRSLRQGLEFLMATIGTWILVEVIKVVVASPRPFKALLDMHALAPHESGYSFPSGHAAMTFAVATTVFLHHRRLGLFLYGFAFVVALSRVYVGVHYAIDVEVGALLGFAASSLVHLFLERKREKRGAY